MVIPYTTGVVKVGTLHRVTASDTRGILVYLTLPSGSVADELDHWSVYLH